jgi:hypothetical protein
VDVRLYGKGGREGSSGESARMVDVVVLGVDAIGTRGRRVATAENPSVELSTSSPFPLVTPSRSASTA